MRLSRPFSILIAGFMSASMQAFADDVCDLRPDLCGGPVKEKKVKRVPNGKNETARAADELEREILLGQEEKRAPSEPPPKPLGFSQVQKVTNSHQSMRNFGRRRPKKIDRSTENVFDAYLDSNAHNPALNSRLPSSQNAFQRPKRSRAPTYTARPDPVVSGGGFNTGQGPHPENGGFSSKPVTLGSENENSESQGPVQNAETPQGGDATSPAGPLH